MLRLLRLSRNDHLDQKHDNCVLCGKGALYYELDFYSGSVEPAVGDNLYGVTSLESGTVKAVERVGGAWADGDAHGTIVFAAGTGSSDFEIDEIVNDTTQGAENVLTVRASTQRWRDGRRYPLKFLIKKNEKYYCSPHARWLGHKGDSNKNTVEEDD